MQTRHNRNPDRSGPMGGLNMAIGSRSSPEGTSRFYNSESRSFNRSFGRNQSNTHPRNFHRPPPAPPMPARADVFMEVGRLAAEYLVSQGVLPPSVLPAKWQTRTSKKPLSEFREFRPCEEENMQFPGERRTSALARLGNTGFGGELGRRKYNDDYGAAGPRNHARGRRQGDSSRNYGSDWGKEYGRDVSWSDRHRDRTSPSANLDRAGGSKRREEHPVGKDNGERRAGDYDSSSRWHEEKQFRKDDDRMDVDQDTRSRLHEEQVFGKGDCDMSELTVTSGTPPKGVDNKDSESEMKGQKIEELSEMTDSDLVRDTPDATNAEIKTESLDLGCSLQMTANKLMTSGEEAEVDLRNMGDITGKISEPCKDETAKEIISGDPTPENFAMLVSLSEKSGADLKALCKFADVPSRIRSSLANGAKRRSILSGEGIDHIGPNESVVNDKNLSVSSNDGSSGGCDEPRMLNSEMPTVLMPRVAEGKRGLHSDDAAEPGRELESGNSLGDGNQASGARPEPLEDGILENDQSLNGELYGSESGDTIVEKRGEKRQHGGIDMDGQHAKRKEWLYQGTKEWLSPASINAGECSNLANPVSNEVDVIGNSRSSGENASRVSHSFSVSDFQLPEVMHKPNFVDTEEKQFFPNSFKICDLNLMESSEAHENRDRDDIFMYPSVAAVKKNASRVDINLSILNSAENGKGVSDGKEIEIIDLEDDSAPEDKTLMIPERRAETAFIGMEEFSKTPAPNTAGIPDSQDGYGLMISELLSNDFPSVTPVPGDINPLDNAGLQNGEVPLADDDSIYMSLGEIPFLSFSRNWENRASPQEDGKPF